MKCSGHEQQLIYEAISGIFQEYSDLFPGPFTKDFGFGEKA